MLPLHDHNPTRSVAWMTGCIAAICVCVFGLQWIGILGFEGAFFPRDAAVLARLPMWVTHQFLHGGIAHLLGNLLFLAIFGNNIEDRVGHVPFLLFYTFCGACAAASQMIGTPAGNVPMVGASGAIAGVMGGYLVLFPKVRVETLVLGFRLVRMPAWLLLGLWFLWQLLLANPSGLAGAARGGGVAYWAHAGGFMAGVVLIRLFDRGSRRI